MMVIGRRYMASTTTLHNIHIPKENKFYYKLLRKIVKLQFIL